MSFLDKALEIFSPSTAYRRLQYKKAIEILDSTGIRKYEGASRGKRVKNWNASNGSANTETAFDLRLLRNRSRDLVRNNNYAKKAIEVIQNNGVGSGIVLSLDGSKATEKKLMEEWRLWAEKTECDFDGNHNLYGLQSLAFRAVAESGEVIIRKRRKSKGFPIQIQVCEAEFLDSSKTQRSVKNDGHIIIQGVQFDENGRKIGYWLYDQHPNDTFQSSSKFVPIEDALHIFRIDRPGQVRGVPWGSSTFIKLRDFDEYEDAQLVRQKIAACFSIFVQDSSHAEALGVTDPAEELGERVEPGLIQHVPTGKQIVFGDPPTVQGYGEYTTKTLQSVAAGFGVTYEQLTNDLSGVNFSSGRMGWLEFYRNVVHWQKNLLIPSFCNPIYDWFLQGVNMMGVKYSKHTHSWTPPRREMIDPVKETKAMVLAIRNGLMSYSEAVRQFGADPDLLLEEIKKYQDKFDEMEIILDCDPRHSKAQGDLNDKEKSESQE